MQNPHIQAGFFSEPCLMLHRIALAVVSEWCQKYADFTLLVVFETGRRRRPLRGSDRAPRVQAQNRRSGCTPSPTLGLLPSTAASELACRSPRYGC